MAETVKTGLVTKIKNNLFESSFAGRAIEELIDPLLIWDRPGFLTNFTGTPSKTILGPILRGTSMSARSSPGLSAKKMQMPIHAPNTRYPSIETEGWFTQTYTTNEFGYKAVFTEDVQDGSEISNRIVNQIYQDVARHIAEMTNAEVLNGALNSFTYTSDNSLATYTDNSSTFGYESTYGFLCGKLDAGTYWNTSGADYVTDIENLKTTFQKQDGYNYSLNRMYMDITLMEDIKLWLYNNGHTWEEDPMGGGLGRDTMRAVGVEMVALNNIDGMSSSHADKVILQDTSVAPCTTYYYTGVPPGFTSWGDAARVMTKSYMADEELNKREVLFRTSQKTVIYEPKAYGVLEVY